MSGIHGTLGVTIALFAFISMSLEAQQAETISGVQMVDVDGHAVRVKVIGLDKRSEGSPVVVFEAGVTNSLEVWGSIPEHVATLAPVVVYDRAGLGHSEWDNSTPTPQHVANRLRRLLRRLGAEPPYILTGYSWGGILARYFAGYHPSDVAGLVLIDPGPIVTQPLTENLAAFDAIGAGQAGYNAYWSAFAALFEHATPAVRAEFDVVRRLMELDPSERDLWPLPDVPMVVVVAGKYLPLPNMQLPYDPQAHFQVDLRRRTSMLQEWVLASSQGTLVLSNQTTHAVTKEAPDLLIWAVDRVLSAATQPAVGHGIP